MRKDKVVKAAVYFASAALFLSIPSLTAYADNVIPIEQGVAGIGYSLDNYFSAVQGKENDAKDSTLTKIFNTEIISPYANLGVSIADSYVNIRSEPSTNSEVVGRLYRGCAADILEYLDGDWVKIESGDVKGYIASNFLAIGKNAEDMIDNYASRYATVNTTTLNVRETQSTDAKILTQIPQGETYPIINDFEGWVEIQLGTDEDTGKEFTGFVSKDFVTVTVEFKYAISIEEENRIKREQEEAVRAEAERKAELAAEEAAKKAEAKRIAEETEKESQQSNDTNDTDHSSSGSSSELTSLRNKIITYAQKFVGNPYDWGGESLTRGADCSGFVQSIYADFGYYIPRVSRDQARYGKKVDKSDLLPGDLIFYSDSSGTVNHVAMYIGDGQIVQAANSRQGIIISRYNYRSIYCIRRIIY